MHTCTSNSEFNSTLTCHVNTWLSPIYTTRQYTDSNHERNMGVSARNIVSTPNHQYIRTSITSLHTRDNSNHEWTHATLIIEDKECDIHK